jgi:hypothetical protein
MSHPQLLGASPEFLATQPVLSTCASVGTSSDARLVCAFEYAGTVTVSLGSTDTSALSSASLFTLSCVGADDTCTCLGPAGRCDESSANAVNLFVPQSLGSGAMRACLHWSDTQATDLDLLVKFHAKAQSGPCVAGMVLCDWRLGFVRRHMGHVSPGLMLLYLLTDVFERPAVRHLVAVER